MTKFYDLEQKSFENSQRAYLWAKGFTFTDVEVVENDFTSRFTIIDSCNEIDIWKCDFNDTYLFSLNEDWEYQEELCNQVKETTKRLRSHMLQITLDNGDVDIIHFDYDKVHNRFYAGYASNVGFGEVFGMNYDHYFSFDENLQCFVELIENEIN